MAIRPSLGLEPKSRCFHSFRDDLVEWRTISPEHRSADLDSGEVQVDDRIVPYAHRAQAKRRNSRPMVAYRVEVVESLRKDQRVGSVDNARLGIPCWLRVQETR